MWQYLDCGHAKKCKINLLELIEPLNGLNQLHDNVEGCEDQYFSLFVIFDHLKAMAYSPGILFNNIWVSNHRFWFMPMKKLCSGILLVGRLRYKPYLHEHGIQVHVLGRFNQVQVWDGEVTGTIIIAGIWLVDERSELRKCCTDAPICSLNY